MAINGIGAPRKFKTEDELRTAVDAYFDWAALQTVSVPTLLRGGLDAGTVVQVKIPKPWSIEDMCLYIGIVPVTWREWRKEGHLSTIVAYADARIFSQQAAGASVKLYDSSIVARRLKIADKQEIDIPQLKKWNILDPSKGGD